MFHSGSTENGVTKMHERALKLVYDNSSYLSFDELLIKDNSVSIHQRNLSSLSSHSLIYFLETKNLFYKIYFTKLL